MSEIKEGADPRLYMRMVQQEKQSLETSIDDKLAHLVSPGAYGPSPAEVMVKETHMSWVFIAGDRVYKLKKPVRYPYLDFRTLAQREQNCREEVRLNRRLAPDVYLEVAALTDEGEGRLVIGGSGKVVDWLVVMRRLPERLLLDHAIATGGPDRADIVAVADLLVAFYRSETPQDLSPAAYVEQFAREQIINERVLGDARFDLDGIHLAPILERVRSGLSDEVSLLEERVRSARIVEGHGDLRPEHVCLTHPPVIIDCLEFSRSLRLVDPFDEIAYLGLECDLLGAGWITPLLRQTLADGLRDHPPPRLVGFYRAYRACLRARLALAHLLDAHPRQREKWQPLARRYLSLAMTPEEPLPAGR